MSAERSGAAGGGRSVLNSLLELLLDASSIDVLVGLDPIPT